MHACIHSFIHWFVDSLIVCWIYSRIYICLYFIVMNSSMWYLCNLSEYWFVHITHCIYLLFLRIIFISYQDIMMKGPWRMPRMDWAPTLLVTSCPWVTTHSIFVIRTKLESEEVIQTSPNLQKSFVLSILYWQIQFYSFLKLKMPKGVKMYTKAKGLFSAVSFPFLNMTLQWSISQDANCQPF